MRFRLVHLRGRRLVLAPLLIGLLAGCGGTTAGDTGLPAAYVRVSFGKKDDPERLLRHYFGGYAAPEGADPFRNGLLLEREGRFYVNLDSLEHRFPGAASALIDRDASQVFEWEEVEAFVEQTYAEARALPPTLAALRAEAAYDDGPDWFVVELDGVMTTARRRIFVPVEALREALRSYHVNEETLRYAAGTVIVGEHYVEDERVETTVMRRRDDGFWDFFVYDAADSLADSTATPPRSLRAPVQCVGCHFGDRLFEPEKSFPARAQPGPHGPRQLYVSDALRNGDVTARFDEHRKRSDGVLGIYNTLFVARLLADRRDGRLPATDAALLEELGM